MTVGDCYCTYFDGAYAPRAEVLVETLREQGDDKPVFALALDDAAFAAIESMGHLGVHGVRLTDVESEFPQLRSVKESRSRMEYVFTLTPWLVRWALTQSKPNSWVTYLDADMAFFSSTDPLYEAIESSSVAIVEHRFTWDQAWRSKYGRFNVAWVGFRNGDQGRACLEWWAEQCLEWCHDEVSNGRFADQGYLDKFPELFSGVAIIDHPGADVAPWNLRRHRIALGGSGEVQVDGSPLVFFHFHGLRSAGNRYRFKHLPYLARTTATIRDHVYRPYCQALAAATAAARTDTHPAMRRRPTVMTSLQFGRAAALRWLGDLRGDFVDVDVR